jgi:arylsulfatase A-like enzyme
VPGKDYQGKSKAGEYGDYIQEVDDAVGKVLRVLDSLGLSKNTMIVFTSDNGPYWRENLVEQYHHKAAGAFRGMKGDAYEGGHRVPFIVRYPGKVKPGTTSNVTTTLANLMSTCADLVGDHSAGFETEDSYSILPVLTGKSATITDQPAIVNISSKGTYDIRKGPWKLITKLGSGGFTVPSEIKPGPGEPTGQLYNLDTDIHEDHNVYSQYPEKVKELTDLLEKIKHTPTGKRFK